MRMHPVTFVKQHPVGTVVCALGGMAVGPWTLGKIQQYTGLGVRVPRVGG